MSGGPRARLAAAVALAAAFGPLAAPAALAQSAGCDALVRAASDALSARLQYDSQAVKKPTSVRDLTCLDGFFNGIGLQLFTNMTDVGALLDNLGGRLCSALQSAWEAEVGSLRCGLTVTGFDFGFGAARGNNFCPTLSIGAGGAALFQGGVGAGSGYYLPTQTSAPTGFQ